MTDYKTRKDQHYISFVCKNCSHVCLQLCTIAVHSTTLNSSDNLSSYPPVQSRQSSHVSLRLSEGGEVVCSLVVL